MKKFILPLLVLLFVGSLFAVESAPSEVVGYFKKDIPAGGWGTLALPFGFDLLGINDVLAPQFGEEDFLLEINSGFSAAYYDGYGWDGELMDFSYGAGYYVNRSQFNGPLTYFIMGTVNPQPFTMVIPSGAYTAFGISDASPEAIQAEDHPFGANPADGDFVLEIDTGLSTTFYEGYGWDGELSELAPAQAYFYLGVNGFTWNYVPGSSPARGNDQQTSFIGTR